MKTAKKIKVADKTASVGKFADLTNVVVAKAVKSAAASKSSSKLVAGEYKVDMLVRITGMLKKGEAFEKVQPNTIKTWLLMAVLASKVNKETFDAVLREYTTAEKNGQFADMEADIKKTVQRKVDKLKGQTRAMVNGMVTTDLIAEIVGTPSIEVE